MFSREYERIFVTLDGFSELEYLASIAFMSVLVWESLYQFLSTAVIPNLVTTWALDKSNLPVLLREGPSYGCSIVHSTFTGICAIIFFVQCIPMDAAVKYSVIPFGMMEVNCIFMGYLIYDFFHVVSQYPKLGGMDLLAHHVVFMICSVANGAYTMMAYPFSWLLLGEISTIFLSLRWILIKCGRGSSPEFTAVQNAFAATFFLTRVAIYDLGLFHIVYNWDAIIQGVTTVCGTPKPLLLTSIILVFVGGLLNWIWIVKIYQLATRPTRSAKGP